MEYIKNKGIIDPMELRRFWKTTEAINNNIENFKLRGLIHFEGFRIRYGKGKTYEDS